MANLGDFDATNIDPSKAIEVLPEGKYLASIKSSELKPTKAGNGGEMIVLTWEILDGPHKGAPLWQRLNWKNPNAQAVEIAMKDLSAICHAVGVMKPRDTAALHGLPATINVKCKAGDDGVIRNEIKGVEPRAAYTQAQAASKPAASGGGEKPATPPWMRNQANPATPTDATGK